MTKENKSPNKKPIATKSPKKFRVKSWYENRYQFVVIQRNILLIFALFSTIAIGFGVVFVNHIVSSRSLEPYIIEVEEKTGIPTVVERLTVKEFTGNELMKQYFINKYVLAAAGYDAKTYVKDLENVRVFSASSVFSDYRSRINARKLGTGTNIKVEIKSIEFTKNNECIVRISTKTTFGRNKKPSEGNQLLTLTFSFDPNIQLNLRERMLNPLGFQIRSYKAVDELVSY